MNVCENTMAKAVETICQTLCHICRTTQWRCVWLVGVSLLLLAPAPLKAELPLSQISDNLSLSAFLRVRGEFWDWFEGTSGDSSYAYAATNARLGLRWTDDFFDLYVETQNTSLLGLPDDAAGPAPQGAFGLGHVYRVHNRRGDDSVVFLKQAHLTLKKLGIEGLKLQGGRLLFAAGAEVMSKDPTIDWVKRFRVSQRMIGPFAWSHTGRSYDGFTASYTKGAYNLTVHGSHPTQGGFDLAGIKDDRRHRGTLHRIQRHKTGVCGNERRTTLPYLLRRRPRPEANRQSASRHPQHRPAPYCRPRLRRQSRACHSDRVGADRSDGFWASGRAATGGKQDHSGLGVCR